MSVHVSGHPLIVHKLSILRDKQTNDMLFTQLVGELSGLLAYEATQDLNTIPRVVETPLTKMNGVEVKEGISLVPIMRAGLGMVDSFRRLLPAAKVWHVGVFRNEATLEPVEYYNKLKGDERVTTCLILDPMLATGGSATATVDMLKRVGVDRIKFICLIAAPEGLRNMEVHHPDVKICAGAIDDHLNDQGYIVPGLGDAGDRQFGTG